MSKRILVTGATGFTGSHILESLMQDGSVTPIAACRNPNSLLPGFKGESRPGDLRDPDYVESVVKDIDVICHAAAWTSLWNHHQQSRENYLEPTLHLIEAAKKCGVKQFVFPSTTSAAAPGQSFDPLSRGIPRTFWPHLCNVIAIEDELRKAAGPGFSTVILRLGLFTGKRYGLGILPILLPRLKTHLVPWVAGGRTHLPLVDGSDIGHAFLLAIKAKALQDHECFNIVGIEQPTVREVIEFIHLEYNYPTPHFSVPFSIAYPFAWLMEKLDPVVPWEHLVTRSIIHLQEETHANNDKARTLLGYQSAIHWKESVRSQIEELHQLQREAMPMAAEQ